MSLCNINHRFLPRGTLWELYRMIGCTVEVLLEGLHVEHSICYFLSLKKKKCSAHMLLHWFITNCKYGIVLMSFDKVENTVLSLCRLQLVHSPFYIMILGLYVSISPYLQSASDRQILRSSRQFGFAFSSKEQVGTMVWRRRSAHALSLHEQKSSG